MSNPEDKQKQEAVANTTSIEHEAILTSQHRLEAALASASTERKGEWSARIAKELRQVKELLRQHVETSEAPDGLLAEIEEAMLSCNDRLTAVRKDHRKLLKECDAVLSEADRCAAGEEIAVEILRRRAASLMTEIRHHQAIETDLIFEAFERDIGNLD